MKVSDFIKMLDKYHIRNFFGVPDSYLSEFCKYLSNNLMHKDITNIKYTVAPNEGLAVSLAIGDYLSTGFFPCVFMQNSGLGNSMNPIVSLACSDVYNIPIFFIIGWRGNPDIKDEVQHILQGKITKRILSLMDIVYYPVDENTSNKKLESILRLSVKRLSKNKKVALLVKQNFFKKEFNNSYSNEFKMTRREVIKKILENISESSLIISTTGYISRELYDLHPNQQNILLCIGGMGHASSVASQIAKNSPYKEVYCFDGDGATLMHMGALAFIGNERIANFRHIVFNNFSHESVGNIPTNMNNIEFFNLAKSCGYKNCFVVENYKQLQSILKKIKKIDGSVFIEILLRPSCSKKLPRPNNIISMKECFMKSILHTETE